MGVLYEPAAQKLPTVICQIEPLPWSHRTPLFLAFRVSFLLFSVCLAYTALTGRLCKSIYAENSRSRALSA